MVVPAPFISPVSISNPLTDSLQNSSEILKVRFLEIYLSAQSAPKLPLVIIYHRESVVLPHKGFLHPASDIENLVPRDRGEGAALRIRVYDHRWLGTILVRLGGNTDGYEDVSKCAVPQLGVTVWAFVHYLCSQGLCDESTALPCDVFQVRVNLGIATTDTGAEVLGCLETDER